jgi:glycosyltransferase involved in cell wall biosynthesis
MAGVLFCRSRWYLEPHVICGSPGKLGKEAGRGILFITPWLLGGGIERVIENSVPWLARRGYRCEVASWTVATQLSGQPNPVLGTLSAAGVPVRPLNSYGRRFRLLQRAVRTAAIALRSRHRLLVGYELEGNLVALLAKRLLLGRVRVMIQIHNASRIHAEVGTSPTLLRLARRLYQDADLIVAVSDSIRLDSVRFFGIDASRVLRLYNPLPIRSIRQLAKQDVIPAVGPTPRFIVGCGRLVRMKGFSDLLRAFEIIRRDHALQLVILGEGPERANLTARAREHGIEGDVRMPGFVANPWSYFGRASAFVLSSLFGESFSMVVVEAMACGVPVIASRCEWGPEEILDRGRYGLLYDPGDVEALTRKLRTVLDEPAVASGLTRAASRRAEEFSQDAILPEFERHLVVLLGCAEL